MSKYSFEFKKKVVKAYLNGEGSYGYFSKTYGVPPKAKLKNGSIITRNSEMRD